MATITKRGKSYRIVVSCGYDIYGKQITHSMTWRPSEEMSASQVRKELNRQVTLFEEECSHGTVTDNIKFQRLAEMWFDEYAQFNHRSTSLQRDRQLASRVYPALGHNWIDKITAHDIQVFINSLARNGANKRNGKPLSQKTIKHHLSFISSIFEYAKNLDMISSNPCRKVVIPKLDANGKLMTKKEKQIYTKEQVKEFMQMIETAPLKYKVFFKLAVYTGCRRGELLGLEWKDINFDEQVIYVHQTSNYTAEKGVYTDGTKTVKSTRTVNMPQAICELLKEYKLEQDKYKVSIGDQWVENDRLFIKWNGEPMHPNTPYTWLMRECERNNFPFYGIHTFRHLFASIEIEAGIDPTTVAATLGHSTPITTMSTYSHYFAQSKQRASNAVAEFLEQGC